MRLLILCFLFLSGCWQVPNCNDNYLAEEPGSDYWQTVKETINLRHGDCEDFAYINNKVNHGSVMVVGEADKVLHAWIMTSNDVIYDTCLHNVKEYRPMIKLHPLPFPSCEVLAGGEDICYGFLPKWKDMLQRESNGQ